MHNCMDLHTNLGHTEKPKESRNKSLARLLADKACQLLFSPSPSPTVGSYELGQIYLIRKAPRCIQLAVE